jgi:hypothetical protein
VRSRRVGGVADRRGLGSTPGLARGKDIGDRRPRQRGSRCEGENLTGSVRARRPRNPPHPRGETAHGDSRRRRRPCRCRGRRRCRRPRRTRSRSTGGVRRLATVAELVAALPPDGERDDLARWQRAPPAVVSSQAQPVVDDDDDLLIDHVPVIRVGRLPGRELPQAHADALRAAACASRARRKRKPSTPRSSNSGLLRFVMRQDNQPPPERKPRWRQWRPGAPTTPAPNAAPPSPAS